MLRFRNIRSIDNGIANYQPAQLGRNKDLEGENVAGYRVDIGNDAGGKGQ